MSAIHLFLFILNILILCSTIHIFYARDRLYCHKFFEALILNSSKTFYTTEGYCMYTFTVCSR